MSTNKHYEIVFLRYCNFLGIIVVLRSNIERVFNENSDAFRLEVPEIHTQRFTVIHFEVHNVLLYQCNSLATYDIYV